MVREGKYGTASGNLNEVLSIRAQELGVRRSELERLPTSMKS